jgi:hypothetical protein
MSAQPCSPSPGAMRVTTVSSCRAGRYDHDPGRPVGSRLKGAGHRSENKTHALPADRLDSRWIGASFVDRGMPFWSGGTDPSVPRMIHHVARARTPSMAFPGITSRAHRRTYSVPSGLVSTTKSRGARRFVQPSPERPSRRPGRHRRRGSIRPRRRGHTGISKNTSLRSAGSPSATGVVARRCGGAWAYARDGVASGRGRSAGSGSASRPPPRPVATPDRGV